MKYAVWIVVRDDVFYIDMAIKSVLPYVDGIFILDTGSTDGTIELIESFKDPKIVLEKIKHDFLRPEPDSGRDSGATHPWWRYDETKKGNSLEAECRTYAWRKCKEIFNPYWILQLDADEVYTPLLFKLLPQYDKDALFKKGIYAIKIATDRFITSTQLAMDTKLFPPGFHDPHERIWNPDLDVQWFKPGKWTEHVVPRLINGQPLNFVWMSGLVHIHLHRVFGPKSEIFWQVSKQPGVPYDPRVNKERFEWAIRLAVLTDFKWEGLEFVIDKWKEWGIW